ncbi:MAG: MMPL family transporter [Wenzhouxiangellaceae bacterium]|nr:MMPL family transporter [Wenzhouxiangellaceae bacterium]
MTETEPASSPPVARWLQFVTRHPWPVLALALVLAGLALATIQARLGVDSDPLAMLAEDLPFRQTDTRIKQQFPTLDENLLIVIDAPTPEQAWLAARAVTRRLADMPEVIEHYSWPSGDAFFLDHGLLLQPTARLEALTDRLADAQALLGRLASDTTAAGLFELLAQMLEQREQLPEDFDLDSLLDQVGHVLEQQRAGGQAMLSWQHLLGGTGDDGPAREVIVVNPVLDHGRVLAARAVMEDLQALRAELGFDQGPVRMRLTGSTPLRFEEMRSVIDGAALTGLLALIVVSGVMLAGLRSPLLCLVALINLALGLVLTAGFAALAIGRVNMISVSFVVLYIGLGVNYAVHYLLRYRELLTTADGGTTDRLRAIHAAGRFLLRALVLSAATTALGFFAFVPTAFAGIAELGLIAGFAMLVTLALSYSVLPALLAILQPGAGRFHRPSPGALQPWQRWPLQHRRITLLVGAALLLAAAPLLPRVGFDSDPLGLRDPDSESVTTIRELLANGAAGYRNIQVLVGPDQDAAALADRIKALPEVERTVWLATFVPAGQDDKLLLIEDLGWLLGPEIIASDWTPDALEPARLERATAALMDALASTSQPSANRLMDALETLRSASDGDIEAVNQALVGGLEVTLGRLARGLRIGDAITHERLPPALLAQWLGADGSRLLQVFPAGNVLAPGVQDAFAAAVTAVAGDTVSGGPIIQRAAGQAITDAFAQALAWAIAGITLVLVLVLRRTVEVAMVLAPLALGGVLTLAAMQLAGLQFNFANVVALPLLLGVAVDNGIHLVERHRAGLLPEGNVLATATARAIVVGALITAGGFGNLAFSPHTGTASLGLILAIGLSLMVIATLVFLPALLGYRRDTA